MVTSPGLRPPAFLPTEGLDRLLDALRTDGRTVIGPTVADDAVVYAPIEHAAELPIGWRATQAPGRVRLEHGESERVFDVPIGLTSWKRFTFPPRVPITIGRRTGATVSFDEPTREPERLAFVGVRACELAALGITDRVLADGPVVDPDYVARRAAAFIVAVECATTTSTCFCTSMGTGPEVTGGADLVLTEIDAGFVIRAGSAAGEELLATLELPPASDDERVRAGEVVAATRAAMEPVEPMGGVAGRLLGALDSLLWAEVGSRCLGCANCTLVCPTCFCTSVTQESDLDGTESVAERTWDSCFTPGFAQVAGGDFRARRQDRYRQWLTHKFGTWWSQFGSSGCVGCGRCIAWCPVGIDVRAELRAIAPPPDRPPLPAAFPAALLEPAGPSAPAEPSALAFTSARVVARTRETADTVTLRLATTDAAILAGRPGQSVLAALPGFAAPPISISRFHPDGLELTVRAVGAASAAITRLAPGDGIGLRGPIGRGWPIDAASGRDVVIVGGGIGLAPLRPIVDAVLAERDRFGAARLWYGARTPSDRLYVDEVASLAGDGRIDVGVTVDRADEAWTGQVGVVTHLFDRVDWDGREAVAFVCGPERMMQAVIDVLEDRGVSPDRIWVTLERHMECGVGLCGHCQLGRFFVCRDGPVFSVAELGSALHREGM